MEKTIYGVFESSPEVLQAIKALKAKGYDGDDITIVADKEEKLEFAHYNQTEDVNTVTETTEEDSFMDKVMRFFTNEGTTNLGDRLGEYGFSDTEALEYVNDVENGKILVLLDSDKDRAVRESFYTDDPVPPIFETERTTGIDTSGLTNNPDPNLFPDGTAAIKETTGDLTANRDGANARDLAEGRTENEENLSRNNTLHTLPIQGTVRNENVQLDEDGNPIVHDQQLKNRIDTDKL